MRFTPSCPECRDPDRLPTARLLAYRQAAPDAVNVIGDSVATAAADP
jgi:hypothetical protein